MAVTQKPFLTVAVSIMVVVLIAAWEPANAAIVGPVGVKVTVSGTVWCSADGAPCGGCPALVGARVVLLHDGTVISSTTTGIDGAYIIYVNNVDGIITGVLNVSALKVHVMLPVVTSCPALATASGALEGTPQLRGAANQGSVLDLVVRTYVHVSV